ncbi:hypothetical protein SAMN05216355_1102 [Actinomyces ruminicola]|uniref:Uncharacterized protein n=1 Tax=Actinomyces ruminicola TaxID=332524 RepID=A0A1H0DBX8_9ACTO|nr:hypothetical protein [Actinomyces ruminicola]SDN67650.1 hypothetical protein SAMN05216355_1102 [Actinomyces ruminicola]
MQYASAPATLLLGFVCFDSAVLFLLQAVLPGVIPLVVPTAIMTVQLFLAIALLCYSALRAERKE